MYVSHGKPRATRYIQFPGATRANVVRAMENLRTLWRNSPTSKEVDQEVYLQLYSARDYLRNGRYEKADDRVWYALETITNYLHGSK